ncbi:MAG: AraC family transcriptional regulator [Allomuricauda sp.]
MELIYKSFFLFFGFQGIFLAMSILLDKGYGATLAKGTLLAVLLLSSSIIFYDIHKFYGIGFLGGTDGYYANPVIYGLLGPIVYLFVKSGQFAKKNSLAIWMAHILPPSMVMIPTGLFLTSSMAEKALQYVALEKSTLCHVFIAFFLVAYSLLSHRALKRSKHSTTFPSLTIKFVVYTLYFITAIFLLILPLNIFGMLGPEIALLNTVALCIFIAIFSFFSITRPDFLVQQQHLEKSVKDYSRYGKSGLSITLSLELRGILEDLMANEKLYLNHDLCLDNLAEKMHISRHHASQIINEHHGVGFHDFVNGYRIKEAEILLLNDDSSVKEIAFLSGFNSRAAFYTAFKKFNEISPVAFRRTNLSKSSLLAS